MSQPKRDWSDAEAKREGGCRICGKPAELAHLIGRANDERKGGSKERWVNPDSVIPLCGPFPDGHHGDYDLRKTLDLLPHLTTSEQARAVLEAGSIESARRRLCPSAYNGEANA